MSDEEIHSESWEDLEWGIGDHVRRWSPIKPFKPSWWIKAPSCISEFFLDFLQLVVLERQLFSWNCFKKTLFFHLLPTLSHVVIVDGDDNGEFRLERVNTLCARGALLRVFFVSCSWAQSDYLSLQGVGPILFLHNVWKCDWNVCQFVLLTLYPLRIFNFSLTWQTTSSGLTCRPLLEFV